MKMHLNNSKKTLAASKELIIDRTGRTLFTWEIDNISLMWSCRNRGNVMDLPALNRWWLLWSKSCYRGKSGTARPSAIDFTHRSWQCKLWSDVPDLYLVGDLMIMTYTKEMKKKIMQVNHNWKMERKTPWTYQDDKNKEILLFSLIVLEDRGQLAYDYLAFDKKHPSWGSGYILAVVHAVASAARVAMPTSLGSCGGGVPQIEEIHMLAIFISPVFVLLRVLKKIEFYTSGSCRGH